MTQVNADHVQRAAPDAFRSAQHWLKEATDKRPGFSTRVLGKITSIPLIGGALGRSIKALGDAREACDMYKASANSIRDQVSTSLTARHPHLGPTVRSLMESAPLRTEGDLLALDAAAQKASDRNFANKKLNDVLAGMHTLAPEVKSVIAAYVALQIGEARQNAPGQSLEVLAAELIPTKQELGLPNPTIAGSLQKATQAFAKLVAPDVAGQGLDLGLGDLTNNFKKTLSIAAESTRQASGAQPREQVHTRTVQRAIKLMEQIFAKAQSQEAKEELQLLGEGLVVELQEIEGANLDPGTERARLSMLLASYQVKFNEVLKSE